MKKFFVCVFVLICFYVSDAQQLAYDWHQFAGNSNNDAGTCVQIDKQNNLFIAGNFANQITVGNKTLISQGAHDIFVLKLDVFGNFKWMALCGGTFDDGATALSLDNSGSIILAGTYKGNINFGGQNVLNYMGTSFVAKYSPTGVNLWAKQINGMGENFATAMVADALNNIYLTGNFRGTIFWDSSELDSKGSTDIFIAKLNASGDLLWLQQYGDIFADAAQSIDLVNDSIVVTGYKTSIDSVQHLVSLKITTDGKIDLQNDLGIGNIQISSVMQNDSVGNISLTGYFLKNDSAGYTPTANNEMVLMARISSGEGLRIDNINVNQTNCTTANDGGIEIHASGGISVLNFSIDGGKHFFSDSVFTSLIQNNYNVKVTDGFDTITGPNISIGYNLPNVSISHYKNLYCANDTPDTLTGVPAGGKFTSIALTNNILYPSKLNTGTYSIKYQYTALNSCSNADSVKIKIVAPPEPDFGLYERITNNQKYTLKIDSGLQYRFWSDKNPIEPLTIYGKNLTDGLHTYYLQLTDSNKCSTIDTLLFSVIDSTSDKENNLRVYPNPVVDFTYVEILGEANDDVILDVFSIDGKKWLEKKYVNKYGFLIIRLDLHHFQNGIYIINVQTKTTKASSRIVVYPQKIN